MNTQTFRGRPVMACPHCGQPTPQRLPTCCNCGSSLVAAPTPPAPRLVTCPYCGHPTPKNRPECQSCYSLLPSPVTRARLWIRRNPRRAVLAAGGILLVLNGVLWWAISPIGGNASPNASSGVASVSQHKSEAFILNAVPQFRQNSLDGSADLVRSLCGEPDRIVNDVRLYGGDAYQEWDYIFPDATVRLFFIYWPGDRSRAYFFFASGVDARASSTQRTIPPGDSVYVNGLRQLYGR